MLTLITGSSGTGKTLAALHFAHGADTLFFIGDENEAYLLRRAADTGLDVSKTVFESLINFTNLSKITAFIEHHLSARSVTRVVIDGAYMVEGLGFGQSEQLCDLADKYDLHILLTNQIRRVPAVIKAAVPRVDDFPMSLRYSATNRIQLDNQWGNPLTGVLLESRYDNQIQELSELFGIQLHQDPDLTDPVANQPMDSDADDDIYENPLSRINDLKSSLCVAVETLVEHYGTEALKLVANNLVESDALELAEEVWGRDSELYQIVRAHYTKPSVRGRRLTSREVRALKPGDKVWVRHIEGNSMRLNEMDEVVSVTAPGILSLTTGSYRENTGLAEDDESFDSTQGWCALYQVW